MNENDSLLPGLKKSLGPHLQPLSKSESRNRVEAKFEGTEQVDMTPALIEANHPELTDFENAAELMKYCEKLLACIRKNGEKLELGLWQSAEHLLKVKEDLVSANVERRGREEEVVNWSFVLKYLLSTNSKLKRQLVDMGASSAVAAMGMGGRGGGNRNRGEAGRGGIGGGGGGGGHDRAQNGNMGFANAFNAKTKMDVMENMEDEAAMKIQVGFRNMQAVDDSLLVNTPKIIAGGQTPKGPLSPASVKKIVPNQKVAAALIERVKNMTIEDIKRLPEGSQAKVYKLRKELGLEGKNENGKGKTREGASEVRKVPIEAAEPSFTVTPKTNNQRQQERMRNENVGEDDSSDESSDEGDFRQH